MNKHRRAVVEAMILDTQARSTKVRSMKRKNFTPFDAFCYAQDVLKGRFQTGESVIAKDAGCSILYAEKVLKGPFPRGETIIAKDAWPAFVYAVRVLKGRFPRGEKKILASIHADAYAVLILKEAARKAGETKTKEEGSGHAAQG